MPENQSITCKTVTLPRKILSFISFISLLILVSTLLVIIGCGGGGGGGGEGTTQGNVEEGELEKKWDFTTGDKVYSSPALSPDGTIYIGSDDTYLYALTPAGNLKWKFKTNDAVFSSPVIGDDGTIYVGSNDNNIYAIKPDGSLNWSYTTGDNVLSKPVIGPNGYIYAGSNDNYLYALNPQGQKMWSTLLNGYVSSPVVGPDGTIYVGALIDPGNSKGKVVALAPDNGSIKWEASIYTISKPDLGANDTIYVSSMDKHLYALDAQDGQEKWKYEVAGAILSSPKVMIEGEDEIIIFGSDDKKLYALNNQGTLLWSTTLGHQIRSSAQIGKDDTIYIGCHNGYLYACRLDDGSIKGYFKTNQPITSIPAVDEDGIIYFGGQDKKIYAVEDNLI